MHSRSPAAANSHGTSTAGGEVPEGCWVKEQRAFEGRTESFSMVSPTSDSVLVHSKYSITLKEWTGSVDSKNSTLFWKRSPPSSIQASETCGVQVLQDDWELLFPPSQTLWLYATIFVFSLTTKRGFFFLSPPGRIKKTQIFMLSAQIFMLSLLGDLTTDVRHLCGRAARPPERTPRTLGRSGSSSQRVPRLRREDPEGVAVPAITL